MRKPLKMDLIRDRRVLAREIPDGRIENIYQVQIMNPTDKPKHVDFTASGLPGIQVIKPPKGVDLPASTNLLHPLDVVVPDEAAKSGIYKITITATTNDAKPIVVSHESTFIVP